MIGRCSGVVLNFTHHAPSSFFLAGLTSITCLLIVHLPRHNHTPLLLEPQFQIKPGRTPFASANVSSPSPSSLSSAMEQEGMWMGVASMMRFGSVRIPFR